MPSTYVLIAPAAKRGALTLVEVLAAVTILGGAVTTMLVAQANSIEQLTESRRQLIVRHMAKELRSQWILDKVDQTVPDGAIIEEMEGWSWTRQARDIQVTDQISAAEVRLRFEYHPTSDWDTVPWVREFRWLANAGNR